MLNFWVNTLIPKNDNTMVEIIANHANISNNFEYFNIYFHYYSCK
jgi:hypothetical protein